MNSRLNERPLYQFVRLLVSDEECFWTMEDVDKYRLFCFDKGGPLIIDKRHHSLKVKKRIRKPHHKTTPFPLLIPHMASLPNHTSFPSITAKPHFSLSSNQITPLSPSHPYPNHTPPTPPPPTPIDSSHSHPL